MKIILKQKIFKHENFLDEKENVIKNESSLMILVRKNYHKKKPKTYE